MNNIDNLKMTVDVVVWTHHFTKLQTKVILRFLKLFKKNPKSGFGDIPFHKPAKNGPKGTRLFKNKLAVDGSFVKLRVSKIIFGIIFEEFENLLMTAL